MTNRGGSFSTGNEYVKRGTNINSHPQNVAQVRPILVKPPNMMTTAQAQTRNFLNMFPGFSRSDGLAFPMPQTPSILSPAGIQSQYPVPVPAPSGQIFQPVNLNMNGVIRTFLLPSGNSPITQSMPVTTQPDISSSKVISPSYNGSGSTSYTNNLAGIAAGIATTPQLNMSTLVVPNQQLFVHNIPTAQTGTQPSLTPGLNLMPPSTPAGAINLFNVPLINTMMAVPPLQAVHTTATPSNQSPRQASPIRAPVSSSLVTPTKPEVSVNSQYSSDSQSCRDNVKNTSLYDVRNTTGFSQTNQSEFYRPKINLSQPTSRASLKLPVILPVKSSPSQDMPRIAPVCTVASGARRRKSSKPLPKHKAAFNNFTAHVHQDCNYPLQESPISNSYPLYRRDTNKIYDSPTADIRHSSTLQHMNNYSDEVLDLSIKPHQHETSREPCVNEHESRDCIQSHENPLLSSILNDDGTKSDMQSTRDDLYGQDHILISTRHIDSSVAINPLSNTPIKAKTVEHRVSTVHPDKQSIVACPSGAQERHMAYPIVSETSVIKENKQCSRHQRDGRECLASRGIDRLSLNNTAPHGNSLVEKRAVIGGREMNIEVLRRLQLAMYRKQKANAEMRRLNKDRGMRMPINARNINRPIGQVGPNCDQRDIPDLARVRMGLAALSALAHLHKYKESKNSRSTPFSMQNNQEYLPQENDEEINIAKTAHSPIPARHKALDLSMKTSDICIDLSVECSDENALDLSVKSKPMEGLDLSILDKCNIPESVETNVRTKEENISLHGVDLTTAVSLDTSQCSDSKQDGVPKERVSENEAEKHIENMKDKCKSDTTTDTLSEDDRDSHFALFLRSLDLTVKSGASRMKKPQCEDSNRHVLERTWACFSTMEHTTTAPSKVTHTRITSRASRGCSMLNRIRIDASKPNSTSEDHKDRFTSVILNGKTRSSTRCKDNENNINMTSGLMQFDTNFSSVSSTLDTTPIETDENSLKRRVKVNKSKQSTKKAKRPYVRRKPPGMLSRQKVNKQQLLDGKTLSVVRREDEKIMSSRVNTVNANVSQNDINSLPSHNTEILAAPELHERDEQSEYLHESETGITCRVDKATAPNGLRRKRGRPPLPKKEKTAKIKAKKCKNIKLKTKKKPKNNKHLLSKTEMYEHCKKLAAESKCSVELHEINMKNRISIGISELNDIISNRADQKSLFSAIDQIGSSPQEKHSRKRKLKTNNIDEIKIKKTRRKNPKSLQLIIKKQYPKIFRDSGIKLALARRSQSETVTHNGQETINGSRPKRKRQSTYLHTSLLYVMGQCCLLNCVACKGQPIKKKPRRSNVPHSPTSMPDSYKYAMPQEKIDRVKPGIATDVLADVSEHISKQIDLKCASNEKSENKEHLIISKIEDKNKYKHESSIIERSGGSSNPVEILKCGKNRVNGLHDELETKYISSKKTCTLSSSTDTCKHACDKNSIINTGPSVHLQDGVVSECKNKQVHIKGHTTQNLKYESSVTEDKEVEKKPGESGNTLTKTSPPCDTINPANQDINNTSGMPSTCETISSHVPLTGEDNSGRNITDDILLCPGDSEKSQCEDALSAISCNKTPQRKISEGDSLSDESIAEESSDKLDQIRTVTCTMVNVTLTQNTPFPKELNKGEETISDIPCNGMSTKNMTESTKEEVIQETNKSKQTVEIMEQAMTIQSDKINQLKELLRIKQEKLEHVRRMRTESLPPLDHSYLI